VEPLRRFVSVAGAVPVRLSYLQSRPTANSAAAPRIVLVHGTPGSASAWADYLLSPPDGAEVLAIDRPGFGRSEPEGAVPGLAEQSAAVRALLPEAGRAVVLVGHSLGGPVVAYLAAKLAVEEPARRVTLVLLAASLDPAQEAIHPMQHVGAWGPVQSLLPRVIRNANAELMALKPELEALGALLPAITARVFIVHGTRDDLVPVANVPYMQSNLRSASCIKTILLEGRNHFLPWNSEDEVRRSLHDALEAAC
jgi:pimeloyl-ACP methyl ester carboxylesterase